MLETGMRVGDAIRFEPAAPVKGEHLLDLYVRSTEEKED